MKSNNYNIEKDEKLVKLQEEYKKIYERNVEVCSIEKEKIIQLGGLLIIGTERHESRRIDNQLRGRAGRQGDPGESVFYISLEDDLIRLFGGDKMLQITNFVGIPDDLPIQNKMLTNMVERAQKRIEARNFGIRRYVLQYDDVMNGQRENIYKQRDEVLEGNDIHEQVTEMIINTTRATITGVISDSQPFFKWDLDKLNTALEDYIIPKGTNLITEQFVEDTNVEEVCDKVMEYVLANLEQKKADAQEIGVRYDEFERLIMLIVVDKLWMDHIDAMDILKREVGIKRYSQTDPIQFYKKQGGTMFDIMVESVWEDVTKYILNTKIELAPRQNVEVEARPVSAPKIANRNAPCPCGSGKKYKNCCGSVC